MRGPRPPFRAYGPAVTGRTGPSGHNGRVSTTSLPTPDHAAELRSAMLAAGFTADGLLDPVSYTYL